MLHLCCDSALLLMDAAGLRVGTKTTEAEHEHSISSATAMHHHHNPAVFKDALDFVLVSPHPVRGSGEGPD
jgi:hypothetical protein